MKIFLSIIIFILVLLFLPIPFKLKVYFSNDSICIKFYKFKIFEKSFSKTHNTIAKNETTKINKEKKKKERNRNILSNLSTKEKFKLISLIEKNKFKPKLYIDGFLNYSLNDAAKTAIALGVINTYAPLLNWALSIIFNIKKFNIPLTPIFKGCFMIETEINCIFTISIAKTIYIVILLINSYIKVKGDELAREDI